MKQIGIALAVAGMVALGAGHAHAGSMHAGVKGGINLTNVHGGSNAPDDVTLRKGFVGGAFFGTSLNEHVGGRVEVLYAQKGIERGTIKTMDGDVHPGSLTLDYIDVPVLLDVPLRPGEKLGVDLYVGPSFNFNIKSEVATEDGVENRVDNTKVFEFGFAFGGGIQYALSNVSLLVDARYTVGTTTVYNEIAGYTIDIKNRGFGLMGGISIPFGD